MDSRLGDDVCIKAVAQVNGVDVVTTISSSAIIIAENASAQPPELQGMARMPRSIPERVRAEGIRVGAAGT